MATLSRIAVHPIKSLDPIELERAAVTEIGGLELDRAYAIVDDEGAYVNGKRTADVHRLRVDVDPETNRVALGVRGEDATREFHLDHDGAALSAWLSEFFGIEVSLESGPGGSRTDGVVYGDASQTGPTIVGEATLREVASWYEGVDPAEMRLRLRPNLVVEGVPAFWEDWLVEDGGRQVEVGDVTLEGARPVPRCVVPTRDPHTGEVTEGFEARFREKRAATLPEWTPSDRFDGDYFQVTTLTRIPEGERDGELAVGDEVRVIDTGEPGSRRNRTGDGDGRPDGTGRA